MATDFIRADTCFIYPYPRPNIHARIRARHPQRAQNHARTRYPRVSRAHGHTRVPADGCRVAGGIRREHGSWEKEGGRRRRAVWRRGWRRARLEAGGAPSPTGRKVAAPAWRRGLELEEEAVPASRRKEAAAAPPIPSREEGSGARTQQGGGGDGGTSWAVEEPRGWRAAHAGAWKGAAAGPPGRRQGQ